MIRTRVRWFDVFALAALGLALLATGPRAVHADDKALGAESEVFLAAAAPAEGAADPGRTDEPRATMSAKQESSPKKEGFFAPTLDGPWRFTAAGYGWLPNAPAEIKVRHGDATLPEDLGTLLDDLQFGAFLDFEVRKGKLGAYVAPIIIFLEDSETVQGPLQSHKVTVDENVYLTDFGLSYEVGRWYLGKSPNAPAVTVEPFVGARWLIDDIKIKIEPGGLLDPGGRTFREDISFIAPVIGLRTFWDLTERWNLRIEGDYGGFDVDHLKSTWNFLGTVGYRFKIGDVSSNVFAGYRWLYIHYEKRAELFVDIKGPLVGIAFDL